MIKEKYTKSEVEELLNIKVFSREYYELIETSGKFLRERFKNKGYVFAQIGLNSTPCTGNCKFCSLSKDYFCAEIQKEKTFDDILPVIDKAVKEGVNELFIMSTADYDKRKMLTMLEKVKAKLRRDMRLVVNTGDFDLGYAKEVKSAGADAAYHIVRLREGIDTALTKETRYATIDAIEGAGLELYYCIEPIGSEHSYSEIAEQIMFALEKNVNVLAAMRRVNVTSALPPEITVWELMKIAAVATLVVKPTRSMNVHETVEASLLLGVNQLYAEFGLNPRDVSADTEIRRGLSIAAAKKLLQDAGLTL